MLKVLCISNLALIPNVRVEFERGLNLLTGETGSGKSIIIDALGLLLGARASSEMIRGGAEAGWVEALFTVGKRSPVRSILAASGIPIEDDELIIRREISVSGKGRIFINNCMATLSTLKEVGAQLVDIHGQHDYQMLLHPQSHLDILDAYGGNEVLAAEVSSLYGELLALNSRLRELQMDEQERLKRIDMLTYQAQEIEAAKLSPGEELELRAERKILSNAERIFNLTSECYSLIYESESSILTQLNRILRSLDEVARIDARFQAYLEQLQSARCLFEDLAYFLRDYADNLSFSPERLDSVESRLSEIEKLKRKYGQSVEEILGYLGRVRAELEALTTYKDRQLELESEFAKKREEYLIKAQALSEKRRKDAEALERDMMSELEQLAMGAGIFKAHFVQPDLSSEGKSGMPACFGPKGIDRVEFMIALNKGEPLRPLAKVASGGELSRIILALKTISSIDDPDKTLIFDEVDAGIGGRVAEIVGRKLKQVARRNQVICVTHLPQIASFADEHYYVGKRTARQGRTETFVERIEGQRRIAEIARMLGGTRITETTTKHAQEMIQLAENISRRSC